MVRAGIASQDWQYGFGGTLPGRLRPRMCKKELCPDKHAQLLLGKFIFFIFF